MSDDTAAVVELLKKIAGGTASERRAAQARLRSMRANGLRIVALKAATEEEREAFQRKFDRVIEKACQVVLS